MLIPGINALELLRVMPLFEGSQVSETLTARPVSVGKAALRPLLARRLSARATSSEMTTSLMGLGGAGVSP
jgi:hypothetical protein